MTEKRANKTWIIAILSVIIAIAALGTATYAWFTNDNEVYTSRAAGRTNNPDVSLLLDVNGGSSFRGSEVTDIKQVNEQTLKELMPVSTDDLENFVVQNGTTAGAGHSHVENEANYYHGQIYIKAESEDGEGKLNLYLTDIDKLFEADSDSLVLNASRIGLVIDGKTRIFRTSEDENKASEQVENTYIGSNKIASGKVLHSNASGSVNAVDDPAENLKEATVEGKYLAQLDLNVIYLMDIYFYLEGCDPDCSGSIEKDAASMYLSFYGELVD